MLIETNKFVRIVALNTRSLNKHFSDILYDFTLLKSDFLCLSETWIENHNDIKNIEGFSCYTSGSGRGKGVAVYSCKKHNLLHSDAIENIESDFSNVKSYKMSEKCLLSDLVFKATILTNLESSDCQSV
jgi:hypothetical protein